MTHPDAARAEQLVRQWIAEQQVVGIHPKGTGRGLITMLTTAFAHVRAEERARCAKIADAMLADEKERSAGARHHGASFTLAYQDACAELAVAIRHLENAS